MSRNLSGFALLGLTMLMLTGCNRGPKLVPVEGTVTLDGDPLAGAAVLFEPQEGARPARGITDASGKFVLTTLEDGDGAHVGINKVSVAKEKPSTDAPSTEEDPDGDEYLEGDTLDLETPLKYASPRTSDLTVDVQSGMEPVSLALTSDGGE